MNYNTILTILNKCKLLLIALIVVIAAMIYFLFLSKDLEALKAPFPAILQNYSDIKTLKDDIAAKKQDLNRILEDKKQKNEAAKNATVKEFYKFSGTGDLVSDFAPVFDNIIAMIKQNGLRMKSIKNIPSPSEDNLIKSGGGAYNGCRVDFVLIGYYPQLVSLLNDLENYPYFINISKFEITPYQYDKKILIANISVVLYSKR